MTTAMEPTGVIHMNGNGMKYLQRNGNKITTIIDVHEEDVVDFAGRSVDSRSDLHFQAVDTEIDEDIYMKMNGFKTLRDLQQSDPCLASKPEYGSVTKLVSSQKDMVGRQSRSFLEALDLEDGSKILEHISMYRKNMNYYECSYECPFHASIRKAVSLQTLTEKDANKDFLWNRKYRKKEIKKKESNIWKNCVKQWSKFRCIWRKSKREVYHHNYGSISSRHCSIYEFEKSMNSSPFQLKKQRSKFSLNKVWKYCLCCEVENEENVPLRRRHRSYTIW